MENDQNKCIEDFLTPEEINKIILKAGNSIKEENLRQTPAEKVCLHSILDIEKPTYRWYIETD